MLTDARFGRAMASTSRCIAGSRNQVSRFLKRTLRRTSSLRLQLLAILFLLGYVASFAHDVTIRHSLCVEHGEWEHDTSVAHGGELGHAPDDGTPKWRSLPRTTEEPHEHCAIVTITRQLRWLAPEAPLATCEPVLVGVHDDVAYATPAREVCNRSAPARGPPDCA